jgi:hypothetical protein
VVRGSELWLKLSFSIQKNAPPTGDVLSENWTANAPKGVAVRTFGLMVEFFIAVVMWTIS